MIQTIFIIIGILVGAGAVLYFYARKEAKQHNTSAGEELIGICKSAVETASQKENLPAPSAQSAGGYGTRTYYRCL